MKGHSLVIISLQIMWLLDISPSYFVCHSPPLGGGADCVEPEGLWRADMEQQCVNAIVNGASDATGHAIS